MCKWKRVKQNENWNMTSDSHYDIPETEENKK